jgi:hypothetical protein
MVSFTPKRIAPVTHWIGAWLGLKSILDAVEMRKGLRNGRLEFGYQKEQDIYSVHFACLLDQ